MTRTPARPVTPAEILAARLDELASRHPDDAELRELADLAVGIEAYSDSMTSPESPALAALAAATRDEDWTGRPHGLEQEMLSGHLEGRFLAMLVHATRARRVLEVGMFTGYSALALAEALPPDGVVIACEIDADVAAFAQRQFAASPAGRRVDVRVAPAADTLAELDGPFDLIFVDADKGGYESYVTTVLDRGLLAPHGLLCVDNTLLQGQPWLGATDGPGAAIAAFNETLAADPRVAQVLVPLRDGVTIARLIGGRS